MPLQGEEIGKLVVQAVQGGVIEKRPVHIDPSEELPAEPIINAPMHQEFDTYVVANGPSKWKWAGVRVAAADVAVDNLEGAPPW